MEELKALLRQEKSLIGVLEEHLTRVERNLDNISAMRGDFQDFFIILREFMKKQEDFMQKVIKKND